MANHISNDPNYQPQGGVSEQASQMLNEFWPKVMQGIQDLTTNDFKNQELPLARIKKIMKLDEDVKMISAEAPVLFAKAAEIFIREMSIRAWLHTEDNKRRTLQRNDIAMAISKFDQFDFLIDIVPRDELKPAKRQEENTTRTSLPDQLQYFLQMATQQQPGAQQQQQTQQQSQPQQQQVVAQPAAQQVQQVQQVTQQVPASSQQAAVTVQTSQPQQATTIQLPGGQVIQQPFQIQVAQSAAGATTLQTLPLQTVQAAGGQSQLIQIQAPQQVQVAQPQPVVSGTTQVYQQVVTPNGEVQNIPIQLTPAQLQAIQMQLQGKQQGQIVIQTSQAQPVQQVQAISQAEQQAFAQSLYQMQMGQGAQQIFIQQAAADDQQADGQDGS